MSKISSVFERLIVSHFPFEAAKVVNLLRQRNTQKSVKHTYLPLGICRASHTLPLIIQDYSIGKDRCCRNACNVLIYWHSNITRISKGTLPQPRGS